MRKNLPFTRQQAAVLLVGLSVASAAAAQRFVWPPAAGDRSNAETAAEEPIGAPPYSLAARPEALTQLAPPAQSKEDLTLLAPAGAAPLAAPAGNPIDWRILENPNGPHAALIFDPVRQVFAVYHVDSASGQIMLKSVRNLSADLRMDQFNSSNPAPKDIQAMLNEAR